MQIQRRIVITISILGVATAVFAGAIGIPSAVRIGSLRSEIVTQQQTIERRYTLRNYVRDSLNEIDDVKARLDAVRMISWREGRDLDFIKAVEHARNVAGVAMTLEPQTDRQVTISPWERWTPVQIGAQGDFPSVMKFLNEVEHLPYYIIFDTITMTSPRITGAGSGNVDATFTGKVYWQSAEIPAFLRPDTKPNAADETP